MVNSMWEMCWLGIVGAHGQFFAFILYYHKVDPSYAPLINAPWNIKAIIQS